MTLRHMIIFRTVCESDCNSTRAADRLHMTQPAISLAIKELEPMKPQIGEVLELFASWYRDLLYFKATQDPDGLLFPEHLSQIQSDAGRMSYEGIQSVLDSIRKAYQRLAANVSFDLTMELLLLSMKDAAA